jgi:hypothetical protein
MCPANHDPDRLRAHLSCLYTDADLPVLFSRVSAVLQE